MKILPDAEKVHRGKSERDILRGISNYTNQICFIIGSTQGDEKTIVLRENRDRFEKTVPVSEKQFREIWDSAKDEIRKFLEVIEIRG
ncbi:MAG: hypothetical protein JRD04_00370 [Deltaproteobacteria bacterium]|nr:hypothetical protein [Deltaproteobacteria bacterium]